MNRLKEVTESYQAELYRRNEEIYELCHQKEVLEKRKKAEKFNFMSLSEKNIKGFPGIDIKTFKWVFAQNKTTCKAQSSTTNV